MFDFLFFIPTVVFFLLTIIFPLCISNIEKIPNAINVNFGNLNADDIRKLDNSNRNYLRNQVAIYFGIGIIVTFLVGILFIILRGTDNVLLALPCNLIGIVVGLTVVLRVRKKANALRK